MSRPRRHRLHSLGMSAAPARPGAARTRFRDDGFAVRTPAPPPRPAMLSVLPPPARGFAADPSDWAWPAAEPSALSWPDPIDGEALAFSVPLGAAETATPPGWAEPQPAPAAAPRPLDDAEAEDDVAAILRENGLVPTAPQPVAAPAPSPAAPAPAAEEPAAPAEDRHAIFGQLGRAMSHANSFQLGRFNFDRHFDMLEEGMSLHPVAPEPVVALSSARELHDLDVLSELAAMSEAAGMPLRRDADTDAFMARVARAQGLRPQALASDDDDETSLHEEQEETEEAFDSLDAAQEEDAHSPWSDNQDEAEAEDE